MSATKKHRIDRQAGGRGGSGLDGNGPLQERWSRPAEPRMDRRNQHATSRSLAHRERGRRAQRPRQGVGFSVCEKQKGSYGRIGAGESERGRAKAASRSVWKAGVKTAGAAPSEGTGLRGEGAYFLSPKGCSGRWWRNAWSGRSESSGNDCGSQ